jgi:hypothetical protein
MGVPSVIVKKSSQGGFPALQEISGILALIASSSTGTANVAGLYTNQGQLTTAFGLGPLPEYGAYDINVSGKAVVAIKSSPSIAATYSSITSTITGSGGVTAGSTAPYEHYSVIVTVVNGFTKGTTGGTYTYSLDGGNTMSGVQAVGTASSITIPNSGVSFALNTGTYNAGDTWSCFTERPLMNNSDITTSLNTLNQTRLPWEGVLIDCAYSTGTVGEIDTWLTGREAQGQFNFGVINTRFLTEPTPTGETPNNYATAMTSLTSADSSNRICVGADGGHVVSLITGLNLKRPTALALCAMAMALTPNIGISPSYVANGPVPGFQISQNSNPFDWDEAVYGGTSGLLDPLRLVTLRSFSPGGPTGCYITNPNVFAPSGSSIIYLQLLRVLNKACSISWQILNTQLGKGVATVLNTTTGAINVDERDAQTIEGLVNPALKSGLSGQVTAVQFALNRDDNLATAGQPVNGTVSVAPLFYIPGFQVTVALVKTITAPTGGV